MQRRRQPGIRPGPGRLLLCNDDPPPPRSSLPGRDGQHSPGVLHLVRNQSATAPQGGGGLQRGEPGGTNGQRCELVLVRDDAGGLPVGVREGVAAQRSLGRGGDRAGSRRVLPAGQTSGDRAAALRDGVPNRCRRLANSRSPSGDRPPQR
jgi:hypothetical protein